MARIIFYNIADLQRTTKQMVQNSLQPLGDRIAEELATRAAAMGLHDGGGLATQSLYNVKVTGIVRNTVTVEPDASQLSPQPGGNPGYQYLNQWGSVHWLVDGNKYWKHTSPIGDDLSVQGLIDVVTQGKGGHFIENPSDGGSPRMFARGNNPTWHPRDYWGDVVNRPFLKSLCRETLLGAGLPLK